MIILSILFFVTAILYSSVGFGGGSTYLALLLIWEIPYYIFPVIALFCNIIVVTGNSINYIMKNPINLRILILLFAIICQFIIGVFTLLYSVPITLGAMHQFGGVLLFLSSIWLLHYPRNKTF